MKTLRTEKEERDKELTAATAHLEASDARVAELAAGQELEAHESSAAAEEQLKTLRADGEEARQKSDSLGQRVTFLQTRLHSLQGEVTDKEALITRLRNEGQTAERNHAMKVAMLATSEAALGESKAAVVGLERALEEMRAGEAAAKALAEEREAALEKLKAVLETARTEHSQEQEHMLAEHVRGQQALEEEHSSMTDALTKEHHKKLSITATLLSQREAEVRDLGGRVEALQLEIATGAPNERRIFELAAAQAKREAGQGAHRDARELAFVQLQEALVARDMEVATLMQTRAVLEAELLGLRRHTKRDGVNMAYLKVTCLLLESHVL